MRMWGRAPVEEPPKWLQGQLRMYKQWNMTRCVHMCAQDSINPTEASCKGFHANVQVNFCYGHRTVFWGGCPATDIHFDPRTALACQSLGQTSTATESAFQCIQGSQVESKRPRRIKDPVPSCQIWSAIEQDQGCCELPFTLHFPQAPCRHGPASKEDASPGMSCWYVCTYSRQQYNINVSIPQRTSAEFISFL